MMLSTDALMGGYAHLRIQTSGGKLAVVGDDGDGHGISIPTSPADLRAWLKEAEAVIDYHEKNIEST